MPEPTDHDVTRKSPSADLRSDTTGPPPDTSAAGSRPQPPHAGPPGADPERAAAFDRYEVRRVLGAGAFGRVVLAFDPDMNRPVAIKHPHADGLDGALRADFLKEARAAAAIDHPNICPVYNVGTAAGVPYLVMRYVTGGTLADLLRRHGSLPPRSAAIVARKLALGLAAAHARGVIHRDLKPANVLYDEANKEVLITDFGLARLASAQSGKSVTQGAHGTPFYMPPEQWGTGTFGPVTPVADVYSLGAILYELLTGRPPFQGAPLELMTKHCTEPPVRPLLLNADIDPKLERICLTALEKRPEHRWRSAAELAAALGEYLRGPKAGGPGDSGVPPLPPAQPAPGDSSGGSGSRSGPPPLPDRARGSTVPGAGSSGAARTAVRVVPLPLPPDEPHRPRAGESAAGRFRRPAPGRERRRDEPPADPPTSRRGLAAGLVCAALLGGCVLAGGGAYFVWLRDRPADAELAADWGDYQRAVLTTGSLPFVQERGPKRAEAWKKAADRGDARAMLLYARALQEGAGVAADPSAAVGWLRRSADKGEPVAVTNLGKCYSDGLGLTRDPAEAVRCYRKAADLGEPLGMIFLGRCLKSGVGTEKDEAGAVKWFAQAADRGAARGMSCLAECHAEGCGVPPSAAESIGWYRKAATLGEPFAMGGLGDAYEHGHGVAKDPAEAAKWYQRAADAGHVGSLLMVARRTLDDGDKHFPHSPTEALALVERARALDAPVGDYKHQIREQYVNAQIRLADADQKAGRLDAAAGRLARARGESEALNADRPGRFYFMQDLARVWFELGNVERARGNAKAAADHYRKAVAVDGPGLTKAARALAELLADGEGGVPRDAAKAAELRAAADKQKIKRFTVPCKVGEIEKVDVHVYVFDVHPWKHPLETQYRYYKEERGFEIPKEVMDSFERLAKIAKENNVSLTELCAYALGEASKDEKKDGKKAGGKE